MLEIEAARNGRRTLGEARRRVLADERRRVSVNDACRNARARRRGRRRGQRGPRRGDQDDRVGDRRGRSGCRRPSERDDDQREAQVAKNAAQEEHDGRRLTTIRGAGQGLGDDDGSRGGAPASEAWRIHGFACEPWKNAWHVRNDAEHVADIAGNVPKDARRARGIARAARATACPPSSAPRPLPSPPSPSASERRSAPARSRWSRGMSSPRACGLA